MTNNNRPVNWLLWTSSNPIEEVAMKTVKSSERSTGMGAIHFTAILGRDNLGRGKWIRISEHPQARYMGRDRGYEEYEVDVADDAVSAQFDRSNRGNEYVSASNGLSWRSFAEARRWAAGSSAPVCPHCGRPM